MLKILSYEELHAKFFEVDFEDDGGKLKSVSKDDDDDDDEKEKKEKKTKAR